MRLSDIDHASFLGRPVDDKPTEELDSDLSIVGNNATIRAESTLRFSKLSISLDGLEDWRRSEMLIADEEAKIVRDGLNIRQFFAYYRHRDDCRANCFRHSERHQSAN